MYADNICRAVGAAAVAAIAAIAVAFAVPLSAADHKAKNKSGNQKHRFEIIGDGTVKDHSTGLQWELKGDVSCNWINGCPGGVDGTQDPDNLHDPDNRYTWSDLPEDAGCEGDCADGDSRSETGTLFTEFLAGLNDNSASDAENLDYINCFANYCDWRIPTIIELRTLLRDGCVYGVLDDGTDVGTCIVEEMKPVAGVAYWSSTVQFPSVGFPTDSVWNQQFFDPAAGGGDPDDTRLGAIAVRGVATGILPTRP